MKQATKACKRESDDQKMEINEFKDLPKEKILEILRETQEENTSNQFIRENTIS